MQAVPMTMIEYLILYVSKGRLNLILYPISPMYLKMLRKRVSQLQGIKLNSQPVTNKNREKHTPKKKQSHAQNNIYVIRQFAYVHGVTGISLLSRKNTKYNLRLQSFLSKTRGHNTTLKNPNCKRRFHNGLNGHGLSLSKSSIKNHTTLFKSGRVIKPDQTKLGSTKPNNNFSLLNLKKNHLC